MSWFTERLKYSDILNGKCPPWGWGFAFRDFTRDEYIVAPVPLNLALGAWHWLMVRAFMGVVQRQLHEREIYRAAYMNGWGDGYGACIREAKEEQRPPIELVR